MFLLRNSAGLSSFHPRKGLRASFRAKPKAENAAGEVLDGTAGETNTEILKNVERIFPVQTGFFFFFSQGEMSRFWVMEEDFYLNWGKRTSLKM